MSRSSLRSSSGNSSPTGLGRGRSRVLRRGGGRWLSLSLFVAFGAASLVAPAFAQETGGGAPPPAGGNGSTAAPGLPALYGAPGVGAQSGAQKDINSYLPSSSQPRVGDKGDTFDLNRPSSGSVVLTNPGASGGGEAGGDPLVGSDYGQLKIAGQMPGSAARVPEFHLVRQGDTLWGISQNYFQNPWEWPRLWSLNPQIENPHWIYPGDQLRMATKTASAAGDGGGASAPRGRLLGNQSTVPKGTVFLRDQGYIGDPERDVWGEVVGGFEEKLMLTDEDTVYLQMNDGVELRLGQRLTVFREVRNPEVPEGARKPDGELVKVYGTVRVDGWDRETRIARGKLIESLDVVERGSKVGPVGRRFDVVPPKPAKKEVEARILSSLYPNVFYGNNQVLFIDKGKDDGLEPGNRLKAIRRGDAWRQTLAYSSTNAQTRVPLDSPEPSPEEGTPLRGDEETFPDEIVAELLVLRVEEYSATCLVIEASRPLEPGERLTTIEGY